MTNYVGACLQQEVPNDAWAAHTHMSYGSPGSVTNQICIYGVPQSLEQYADQAQIANYVQYRYLSMSAWTCSHKIE